jgi:shikimate kinase
MKRIILVGFMGAGKSTLGKELAALLAIPFMDSDSMIEEREGKNIESIFRVHGETYFRELEQQCVAQLPEEGDFVFAAGGGLPCHHNLMDQLNELGTTYYVKNTPKTLLHRLKDEREKRPLLAALDEADLAAFISSSLQKRERYYLKAHVHLTEKQQNAVYLSQLIA